MSDYLLLWLEAPLQSWGHDSKFGRRDSLDFPTKSGVLGLICCARGAGGAEAEWLERWNHLDMQVLAFLGEDEFEGVLKKQPLLHDFHMVGSGYDDSDPWQNLLIPKTSEGKKAVGGGTKITHRYYLQDMAYAVILECPKGECEAVAAALKAPVWDLFLGRKSCPPTEFIYQGHFTEAAQAKSAALALAEQKHRHLSFEVKQGALDVGEVLRLNDVPLQFGERKRYKERVVTVVRE